LKGNILVNGHLVLIDDDPRILNKVKDELLEIDFPYEIHLALNGQEGLVLARRLKRMGKKISLFIVDYEMPLMNGLEFLKDLRSSPTLGKIPVLMLTSANDKARVIQAINEGVTNYCLKPWKKDELLEKIYFCLNLNN
jgi:two-component system chemotaxis response regulator CheY